MSGEAVSAVVMVESVEDLELLVRTKVDALRLALQIRDVDADDEWLVRMLHSVESELQEAEALVQEMQQLQKQRNQVALEVQAVMAQITRNNESLQHMLENLPKHLPGKQPPLVASMQASGDPHVTGAQGGPLLGPQAGVQATAGAPLQPAQPPKKERPAPPPIPAINILTVSEFEAVPAYLKGRMAYEQVNGTVHEINCALASKYTLLRQPKRSLGEAAVKRHRVYREQETPHTKGHSFFVENDLRENSKLRVDKRLFNLLGVLRHCQRLREVRGGGLTRYVVL
ncbi:spindle and kinetochore-associated protein 1-like [Lethenteron reissneri]|uniref:spindle and kinetochore-associated protein 1-like n=1 Tax=Lethenteron reissneri TaxID=7753 RepID=UPI002AB7C8A1|nr:spindle and kinetochore-associated protein 1-like [Lethenteron reissneri]